MYLTAGWYWGLLAPQAPRQGVENPCIPDLLCFDSIYS